ncbi:uncharacterized protein LOC142353188 [Convolutriloba macropyga]|uniref:uncharacterized protein LOC142353188 n=1 Tax=Convolutriloba macropyga TaxID=536237 RepID=UPI003F525B90
MYRRCPVLKFLILSFLAVAIILPINVTTKKRKIVKVDCIAKSQKTKMTGPEKMSCYMKQSPNPEGFRLCILDSQQWAYDYGYRDWTHRQETIDTVLRPWFLDCLKRRNASVPILEKAYALADMEDTPMTLSLFRLQ